MGFFFVLFVLFCTFRITPHLVITSASLKQCNIFFRHSSPSTLTGKVNQLELILRQLQYDLRKVSRRAAARQCFP